MNYLDYVLDSTRRRIFLTPLKNCYVKAKTYAPRWASWDGFDLLVKDIAEQFDISKNRAIAILLVREDQKRIVHEVISEKVVDLLASTVSSLQYGMKMDITNYIIAEQLGLSSFDQENPSLYLSLCREAAERGVHMERFTRFLNILLKKRFDTNVIRIRAGLYCRLRLDHQPLINTVLLEELGEIDPVFASRWSGVDIDVVKGVIDLLKVYDNRKIFKKLNPEYYSAERGMISIADLMEGGMKLKDLLPGLTKKERDIALVKYFYRSLDKQTLKCICLVPARDLPSEWLYEIKANNHLGIKSIPIIARWMVRHRDRLARTREVQGPGGQVITFHYHYLLRNLREGMIRSEKTAWRKVMKELEEIQVQILRARANENVPLAQIKDAPKIKGVRPIRTSKEIIEYGDMMDHCVGNYVEACISGQSYIFHLGEPAPRGCTIEVIWKKDRWIVAQAYRYKNKEPDDKDIQLYEEFVQRLNVDKGVNPSIQYVG